MNSGPLTPTMHRQASPFPSSQIFLTLKLPTYLNYYIYQSETIPRRSMQPIRPQFRQWGISPSPMSSFKKDDLPSLLPISFPGQTSFSNQSHLDDASDTLTLDSTLSKYTKCTQESQSQTFEDQDVQFFPFDTVPKSARKQLKKEMKKQKIKRKQQEKKYLNLHYFQKGPLDGLTFKNQSCSLTLARSETKNWENSFVGQTLESKIQKYTEFAFANPAPNKKIHIENDSATQKSYFPFLSLLELEEVRLLSKRSDGSANKQNLFPEQVRIIQQIQLQYSRKISNITKEYLLDDLREQIQSKKSKKSSKLHKKSKLAFIQNLIDHSQRYQLAIENAKPHDSNIQKISLNRKDSDSGKKTLLIDLDDTLIFTSNPMDPSQILSNDLKITQTDGKVRKLFIRPHAHEFLAKMSRHYEIIIFTAATKCYAEQIRKYLDPTDSIISHLLDRQFCFNPNKGPATENKLPFIKDLRKLNRDLSQTVLLDNSIYCFWYQINNGVPIVSYNKQNSDDTELLKVQNYLMALVYETDVRKKNQEYFKLEKYEEHVDARTLVEELYMNRNVKQ